MSRAALLSEPLPLRARDRGPRKSDPTDTPTAMTNPTNTPAPKSSGPHPAPKPSSRHTQTTITRNGSISVAFLSVLGTTHREDSLAFFSSRPGGGARLAVSRTPERRDLTANIGYCEVVTLWEAFTEFYEAVVHIGQDSGKALSESKRGHPVLVVIALCSGAAWWPGRL